MNQYPGFVPMMVPQPYMVAMPTAIPMSGAVGPGLSALPQVLHPQVAAAHMAGAPVVTSSMVNAPGMPSVRPGQLPQGVGQLPQGVGQLPQGVGQLPQGMGQHLGLPGMAGLPGLPHPQGAVTIPTAKVIPQVPASSPEARKMTPFGEPDKGKGGRFGNRWQSNPEQDVEDPGMDDSACVLDHFNSDLNLVIDSDGYGASVMLDPPGFCFTWAGARATYGVCKGKVYYEVHVLEHLPADFGDDHQEVDPHVVRVGWSVDSSSFQLGEEPWSFGYGGTGKFSTNCRFSNYGQRFGAGDVIGAMLDLDARPASISFTKNGTWFGVAIPLHGFPVGSKDMALYPHVLSKNCRLKLNFGQTEPWFPPPQGFAYIGQLPLSERVHGMRCPERKADCEMIMIVGLPGVGKTTWGINMQKSHPEKRYNIIGTDTLIDKMRVMGLPRKRNYHGRWDVLIDKATKCLNKLFQMASRRKRNYILDQTNVYASARRRKMKFFNGFFRIAAVLQPEDPEMQRRSHKRTVEDGKVVPESAVMEMKANFSLPEDRDNIFDRIDFIELPRDKVIPLLEQYVREGHEKRPPREEVFRHDNRFQKPDHNRGYGGHQQQGSRNQSPFGPSPGPPPRSLPGTKSPLSGLPIKSEPQWYGEGAGLLGQAPGQGEEPNTKRLKLEGAGLGGRQGGALDLLKQQYEEAEPQDGWPPSMAPPPSHDFVQVKEEGRWAGLGGVGGVQDPSMMLGGGVGMGMGLQGASPLPPHLAHQAGALVVSHPSGQLSLAQPPPPPPPIMPGQLAHTAAGPAFVALAPLPPPGPPPTMLAMGGAQGLAAAQGLGAMPPGFAQHLQALDTAQQSPGHLPDTFGQGGQWLQQQGESSSGATATLTTTTTTTRFSQPGSDGSSMSSSRDWAGEEGAWSAQGGRGQGQEAWSGQEKGRGEGQKGWGGGSERSGGGWQQGGQGQRTSDRGRTFDQGRGGRYGGEGTQRDGGRPEGYDSQGQGYDSAGDNASGRRFEGFNRPPPDGRGSGGRSDDQPGGRDGRRERGFGGGAGSQSYGEEGGGERGWQTQRGGSGERWGRSGQQDSGGQWGRGDSRGQTDRWASNSGRQDSRPQSSDRWGSRGQDSRDSDRERGRDRDRGGRDRDQDRDRDSYGRDRDRRDRDRDRGSRDRDQDSSEPRQRRRKSKWDTPDDETGSGGGKGEGESDFNPPAIKQEPLSMGYGAPPPPFTPEQRLQFYGQPPAHFQQGKGRDEGPFPQRGGVNLSKPPPPSASGSALGPGPQGLGKDRAELPSLLDVRFGSHPPPPLSGRDGGEEDGGKASGETSLLGPVPSGPPPKFPPQSGPGEALPDTGLPPPPRDGPPPFSAGGSGSGMTRPPFPPPANNPRFSGPGGMGGGQGQRPSFQGGPQRPMRPRNPQNFAGPPASLSGMGGPPNTPWNQPRFEGGAGGRGGMPPMRPRFEGPGGPPGGGRFPGGPGPMRWPRGPR